jgi:hypothetical protein
VIGSPFGGQSWTDDVKNKIVATGRVGNQVDTFDSSGTNTPTLAFLQQYSGVLAFTDSSEGDSVALGNNLADYIDGGGGVVLATFAVASIPIGGRLQSGGYYPILPASQNQLTRLFLGTRYVPAHPILQDVTSFDGGSSSYYGTGSVALGALRIADWTNGAPLIATKDTIHGKVAALNFFPPSDTVRSDFWVHTTNGDLLLANALRYVQVPEPAAGSMLIVLSAALLRRRRRTCN